MQNEERIKLVSFRKCVLLIILFFVSLSILGCITRGMPKQTITVPRSQLVHLRNLLTLYAWQGKNISEALEIWGEPTERLGGMHTWVETSTNAHGTFQCKTYFMVIDGKIRWNPSWEAFDDEGNQVGIETSLGLSYYLINKAPPGFNFDEFNLEEVVDEFNKNLPVDFQMEFSESM